MEDLKQLMRKHYLQYASYVILDRAIPNVIDGLKPVQRRILYILWLMHDGKLHKVANVAGQTMSLHPHGDAPITEALINLANKGFLLDTQGNFGNLYTGDPAAASRYIEVRLSPLAYETLFNKDLTAFAPSYDGRQQEPLALPSKLPLLLLQGAEGIAVGMATSIFPHNFNEVLEAEIAYLEGRHFTLYPDFPTGGIMDASEYKDGRGKIKVRAVVETKDPKTLVIKEICPGTNTEAIIRSIDEAAKKGKLKIEEISDFTAEKVEIEIKLPRGHYAQDLIDALYAYTDCEVTLHANLLGIKESFPWEGEITQLVSLYAEQLVVYLQRELEIEREELRLKIFAKTLEQLFIENRIYLVLETIKHIDSLDAELDSALSPYYFQLTRLPTPEERAHLLELPMRRILRYDLEKSRQEVEALSQQLKKIEKDLGQIRKVAIRYLKNLISKYGAQYPRKTKMESLQEIDLRELRAEKIAVGYDLETGFVGTKVAGTLLHCTTRDKLICLFDDGTLRVTAIADKSYLPGEGQKLIGVALEVDRPSFQVLYCEQETGYLYAKRFQVEKFILGKTYSYLEPNQKLIFFSMNPKASIEIELMPAPRLRELKKKVSFEEVRIKNREAKGIRVLDKVYKKVKEL